LPIGPASMVYAGGIAISVTDAKAIDGKTEDIIIEKIKTLFEVIQSLLIKV
jgi:hypothetical protein